MPTSTLYQPRTMVTWTKSGGNWIQTSASDATFVKRTRTWPATVQRPRPFRKDEFLSGTARAVSSKIYNDPGMDYTYSAGTKLNTGQNILGLWNPTSSSIFADRGGTKPAVLPSAAVNRDAMYNSIRNKIRGEYTNLANMLGEYRQTAQLFRDIVQVVHTRGASLLKRHPRIRGARRMVDIPSTAANAHLQFVYGIKPLMQDLGTAVGELSSRAQFPVYLEGHVARKQIARLSAFQRAAVAGDAMMAALEFETQAFAKTTYRATLDPNSFKGSLAQHGVLNSLSFAWERTPYSFVVDWFFNVGDMLASLDNLLIFNKLQVIDSQSIRTSRRLTPFSSPPGGNQVEGVGTAFYWERSDSRTAPSSISLLVTPQYKPSHSVGHILNGLALLQQLRR